MKKDIMQLTLGPHEQDVLSAAVQSAISDLGTEIGHTDKQVLREDLRNRKAVLLAILDRLTVVCGGPLSNLTGEHAG
jgi:hypothetical protein